MTEKDRPTHSDLPSVQDGEAKGAAGRPGIAPPSRDELLRVRAGEPEALGRFFDRYFPLVYGVVARLLGDRTAAEDATQEVFVKVHRAIGRLDVDRDPGPWLTTISYNVCRDQWRSAAGKMARQSASIDDQPEISRRLEDQGDDPEESTLRDERERLVREAIDRLPEPQREVVILHDYQGMTHEQIAELIGASHAATRKRYSRALSALADLLRETLR